MRTAPCNWPIVYPPCEEGQILPEPLDSMAASGVEVYEKSAVDYLWRWTGRVLGTCTVTIRPCRQDCTAGESSFYGSGPRQGPFGFSAPWTPVIIDGLWFNVGCGLCGDACGCEGHAPLKVPGPVVDITEIKEDSVTLDPSTYYVDNDYLIVRTDGKSWAECGLEITYERGVAVPTGGQLAAGILATELAKAACGDESCGLPTRVQTVTRQGVTIAMLDSFDDVDKGHTGIWAIDSWVTSMTKPLPAARVLSPDRPRTSPRRKTWPS